MRPMLLWLLLCSPVFSAPPMLAADPWCGLEVVSFGDGGKGLAKAPTVHGVWVTGNNLQFNRTGGGREIQVGDLIAEVDGIAVETADQFRDALNGKRGADLKVYALAKDRLSLRFTARHVSVRTRGAFAKELMRLTADPVSLTKQAAIDPEKVYGKARVPPVSLFFTLDPSGKATDPRLMVALAEAEAVGLQGLSVRSGEDVVNLKLGHASPQTFFGQSVEAASVRLQGDALKAAGFIVTDPSVSFCLRGDGRSVCLTALDAEALRITMTAYEAYGGEWPMR